MANRPLKWNRDRRTATFANNAKRGDTSKHTLTRGQQLCYNCNESGHFADKCPQPKKVKRVFIHAAHTEADGEEVDNEEGAEDAGEQSTSEARGGDPDSGNEDESDGGSHIIEVAAGDFYEGVEPDGDYLTSLHAFPLELVEKEREKITLREAQ